MPTRYAPRARYAALAAFAVAAGAYQTAVSWTSIRAMRVPRESAALSLNVGPGPLISQVGAAAGAAGVRPGDRLIAVDGAPYVGYHVLARALAAAQAGDSLRLTIDRHLPGGATEQRDVTLRTAPQWENVPARMYLIVILLGVIVPMFCLLLGFAVAAIRPYDRLAWFLLLLMVSFSQVIEFSEGVRAGWPWLVRAPAVAYRQFFAASWPIWMLLFGLYFPTRFPLDRRAPWAKWLLIVPLAALVLTGTAYEVGNVERFATVQWLDGSIRRVGSTATILGMIAIAVFFACIGVRHGSERSPDARRRLRLLEAGAQISLGPVGVLLVWTLFAHRDFNALPAAIKFPAVSLMALFPLTLAYVIVVQRALDLRVVIRQSLQYALARNGILTMQVAASVALIFVVATLVTDPAANRPRKIQYIAVGIAFLLAARRGADRLRAWTDRKFFREAYHAEQILSDLADQVRTMLETGPLLTTVVGRIAESLHITRAAAMLRDEGAGGGHGGGREDDGYAVACSIGFDSPPDVRVSGRSELIEQLVTERRPVPIYLENDETRSSDRDLSAEDRSALIALDAQLIVPLVVGSDLPGIITLGEKRSEEAYSATDVRLLQSVAAQTGLALQNSRLSAAIAAEVARRERQNREIEIAREVQQGLFPQDGPAVPNLEYAGHCRPASGVGGDYYDFLDLPGGRFGFAIGDISGKGIPAALLMAGLQASLRAQTIARPLESASDLGTLVANLNRLIFQASPPNRYATFFYGQYDPATLTLTYVNAGHNPPMLLRSSNGTRGILRLGDGGPVIGLMEAACFRAQTIALESGDLLVAYTDGISESMNAADEEWGDERLADAVSRCDSLRARAVIDRLMGEADAFAAGAPQHDDMTLVVVRVGRS